MSFIFSVVVPILMQKHEPGASVEWDFNSQIPFGHLTIGPLKQGKIVPINFFHTPNIFSYHFLERETQMEIYYRGN